MAKRLKGVPTYYVEHTFDPVGGEIFGNKVLVMEGIEKQLIIKLLSR